MKQKKIFLTLAASAMIAAGFTSCSVDDNPTAYKGTIAPVEDTFDEGSLIKNGSCNGSLADNFWVHEWRTSDAQFDGTANLIYDPADINNRCAVVVVRSNAEALEAGTGITTDGNPLKADFSNFASWDSQFFVTFGADEALQEGDVLHLKMKVKADKEIKGVETQAHAAPGAYLHWACVGNIDFTTEWKEFESTITVAANQKGMYTIALNLSKGKHYTAYFDDIRVETYHKSAFDSDNAIVNGECESPTWTVPFRCHEWRGADDQLGGENRGARIVVDPADSKNHCAAVVVRSQDEALAAGNMVADGGKIAGWDSQFFITFGEDKALKAGDKLKLQMRVKADVAQDGVGTQSHAAPGGYIHWYCLDNVNFTTEWANFEKEVEVSSDNSWGKAAAGMYTIAFNLSNGQHNTFYFDDIKVTITKAE